MKVVRAHDVLPEPPITDGDALRLMTIAEVASELRCSKGHVQNLIRGRVPSLLPLPVLHIGRRMLIRRQALLRWMVALENRPVLSRSHRD